MTYWPESAVHVDLAAEEIVEKGGGVADGTGDEEIRIIFVTPIIETLDGWLRVVEEVLIESARRGEVLYHLATTDLFEIFSINDIPIHTDAILALIYYNHVRLTGIGKIVFVVQGTPVVQIVFGKDCVLAGEVGVGVFGEANCSAGGWIGAIVPIRIP